MKVVLAAVLFAFISSCGGGAKQAPIVIPPNADLKTDVVFKRDGGGSGVEVVFYVAQGVAPGVKTGGTNDPIAVGDATFNGQPLAEATSEAGQPLYKLDAAELKGENIVSAVVNGRRYEAKVTPYTTLQSRSVTAVMSPK